MRKFLAFLIVFLIISVSIQIHEWAHALTAIKFGLEVDSIAIGIPISPYLTTEIVGIPTTISPWLVGGGAYIRTEDLRTLPSTYHILFLLAGPLAGIVLGYPLVMLIRKFDIAQRPEGDWSGVLGPIRIFQYSVMFILKNGFLLGPIMLFALINFGLGLFNLLPFFPLDGGRIAEVLILPLIPSGNREAFSAVLHWVMIFGLVSYVALSRKS